MSGERDRDGPSDGEGADRSGEAAGASDPTAGEDRPRGADGWLYGWALGYAAVGAASLLVPLYAIELGAGALVVSLIAATAAFAGVPGAILWGRLVTRTRRRRPFILVALGLTAVVFLLLPFLGSPWSVLVVNAALWFVIAAAAPVLNIIVVEGFGTDQWTRRFGLLNHYQGYGWLAGLAAGGAWSSVAGPQLGLASLPAMRLFFVVSAVATVGGFLLVVARYPEASTISEQRFRRLVRRLRLNGGTSVRSARGVPFGPVRIYWALRDIGGGNVLTRLRTRFSGTLLRYLLGATIFFAGFSAFFGPLPAYLVDAGYATDEVFALFIVNSAASAAVYARAGALATTRDPLGLQVGALGFRVVAFPIVAVAGAAVAPPFGLLVVGALFLAIGASWAFITVTATALVSRLAPESARGEALGLYTAIGSLGGGLGSVLGGAVAEGVGYLVAFLAAGGLVVVAIGLVRSGAPSESAAEA
ncbi:MFS transporter [Halobellus sp. EA9]|uniref:MFS transporter n=1 Tax=Halobellus sp. EA9 TaxID=3421647 RepID=UPI003EB9394E